MGHDQKSWRLEKIQGACSPGQQVQPNGRSWRILRVVAGRSQGEHFQFMPGKVLRRPCMSDAGRKKPHRFIT